MNWDLQQPALQDTVATKRARRLFHEVLAALVENLTN